MLVHLAERERKRGRAGGEIPWGSGHTGGAPPQTTE